MIHVDIEQQLGRFHLAAKFSADAPVVGLFGPSGAGKSTVINAIAGIAKPGCGCIRVNGLTLFEAAKGIDVPPDKRRIGYVFQDALLFPHLDVESNLLYGLRLRSTMERFIEPPRVIDLLGLNALLRRATRTLSGGEKQRVAIGRALLAQPRILLMDEPLAALDVPRKTEVLDYIERLRDELGLPIVYVSHSVPEITRLADTVVVMAEGKCVAVGDVESVMGQLDFETATGWYEGGSLVETLIAAHDDEYRLTTLSFDGGELLVPLLDAAVGERVRARIRARDVSLALERPTKLSILNVLPGRVTSIANERDPISDVQVSVGKAKLTARITRRSIEQLDIRTGQEIYVLVKAVSFDQRSVGYA
jgi:molybdate transport system ATP-binding protein